MLVDTWKRGVWTTAHVLYFASNPPPAQPSPSKSHRLNATATLYPLWWCENYSLSTGTICRRRSSPRPFLMRPLKDDYTKGNTPGSVKVLINFLDTNDDRVEDNRLRWRKILSEINSDEVDDDVWWEKEEAFVDRVGFTEAFVFFSHSLKNGFE